MESSVTSHCFCVQHNLANLQNTDFANLVGLHGASGVPITIPLLHGLKTSFFGLAIGSIDNITVETVTFMAGWPSSRWGSRWGYMIPFCGQTDSFKDVLDIF
jgi:hypothetical protein